MSRKFTQILVFYSTYFCSSLSLNPTYRGYYGCSSRPCLNGGSCNEGYMGYTCQCTIGFKGLNCEVYFGYGNECFSEPCANGGTCIDGDNRYQCVCTSEYTEYTFQNCAAPPDVNECASSPCVNGGSCQDQQDSYTCECEELSRGKHCEILARVVISGYDGPIFEGQPLNLFCALTGYEEEDIVISPQFLWIFKPMSSTVDKEVSYSNFYYKSAATKDDAGIYSCLIVNFAKLWSTRKIVDVVKPTPAPAEDKVPSKSADSESADPNKNYIIGAVVGIAGFGLIIMNVAVLVKYGIVKIPMYQVNVKNPIARRKQKDKIMYPSPGLVDKGPAIIQDDVMTQDQIYPQCKPFKNMSLSVIEEEET